MKEVFEMVMEGISLDRAVERVKSISSEELVDIICYALEGKE